MSSDINQPESRNSANKRLAKNTIALYIRMAFAMLVSLYTSRVVLQTLGVEDFGTYGVVGGIVTLFAFVNNTLVSSIQRFLNFELGKGSRNGVTKVFSNGFHVQVIFAAVIVILGETIGLYYLNNYVKVPDGRMYAANWVFQFAILTTVSRIIRSPFNASMIAHERMTAFAIIGIVDVCMKLLIVYMLLISSFDRLITYAALGAIVSVGITLFYVYYNNTRFKDCRILRRIEKPLLKQMLSFSGWNLLGSVAVLATYQGVDLILNYFYGVVVNAALSIANQVYAATTSFTGNFQTAFRPQITKKYAENNFDDFFDLVYRTTKYSFFLVIICAVPLFFRCNGLLSIWLGIVPKYATEFCQYIIMVCVVDALAAPLAMSANATGEIKVYQIIISSILFLNFPVTILLMNLGLSPTWALITRFLVCCFAFIYRVVYMVKVLKMNFGQYFTKTVIPCVYVFVPTIIVVSLLNLFFDNKDIILAITYFLITLFFVISLGLSANERRQIKNLVLSKLKLRK
ncbi:MAG: lipopolysaccharide biosynthesis protein [Muribaculaceae bacterium]|nr:lipopolysaccharide biosynthesis protein [Muribaculaceae bacterium]